MKFLILAIQTLLAFYTPEESLNLTRKIQPDKNDEPYTEVVTRNNRSCVYIPQGKFAYFTADKSVIPPTMDSLIFKITYLDEGTGEVRLQYNATNNRNYESSAISKQNTGEWITATMAITDASLRAAQNHGDFRINDNNYIARIEIYNGRLNPESEPICQHTGGSSYSEFIGKSVAGYQVWFKTGGKNDFWHHWGNDVIEADGTRWPRPYNHTFEIYPDVTLYGEADLAQTGFANLGNGEPSKLYAAQSSTVIKAQFDQMQATGLQGVAVQRFLGGDMRSIATNPQSHLNLIRQQAERTNRLFYICYDITSNGLETTWADLIRFDWVYNIEQNHCLTQSPAYATVNGKPVVEVWGIGFGDRPGNAERSKALIQFLQSRGCYVIAGVPTYWREQRNDARPAADGYEAVYQQCDMLSPWLVGRFSNTNEAQYFYSLQQEDVRYCQQHGMDYMPVLFAGFGWATWNTGVLNQAPRQAGAFLWDQALHARQNGCQNLYFAMLDEYDEGTALLNAATDYTMIPTDAYFLTYAADGRWLSSDFYLRLAGEISTSTTSQMNEHFTTPYSLGPVYYRNSFEQRTTKYNMEGGVYKSEGTFPIDPCFYQNKVISQTNLSSSSCQMVKHDARTGDYAVQLSITTNGAGNIVHQVAALHTPITEALRLTMYCKGAKVSAQLCSANGEVLTATAGEEQNGWTPMTIAVPATMIGDQLTSLRLVMEANTAGTYIAYVDDVLLETDPNPQPTEETIVTNDTKQNIKILHNGQLIISRNGSAYTILGTELR